MGMWNWDLRDDEGVFFDVGIQPTCSIDGS